MSSLSYAAHSASAAITTKSQNGSSTADVMAGC
jgi:hypothetical protein